MEKRWEKLFWITVLATLVIKVILAVKIPFTGDEAYFYIWGKYPALGFYDHPPMVGWILALMLTMGKSLFFVRLPIVLFTTLIGVGLYLFLRRADPQKAAMAAILYLISPLNLINVIITTDSSLIFFTFLSVVTLYFAIRKENYGLYLLSGVFFGLAFLSKYFSALLGLAYLAYFFLSPKTKKKTFGFLILFATLIPFIGLNIYWNYNHCWANIMFNVINRNRGAGFSVKTILAYLLYLVYLFTPPVLVYFIRKREEIVRFFREGQLNVVPYVLFIPFALFALLSTVKSIGVHWPLSFYAFSFILLALILAEKQLKTCLKFMLIFSGLHLILLSLLISYPSVLKHSSVYRSVVLGTETRRIVEEFRPYWNQYHLATPNYSDSAILSYHTDRYVSVFGPGSYHARHDDIMTDFRLFKGKNILIFSKHAEYLEPFTRYFAEFDTREIQIKGVTFYMLLGRRFDYELYKSEVLQKIKDEYYQIPSFLPKGDCYFEERYFK